MNAATVGGLIIDALEELENLGVIKIGGWDPVVTDKVLELAKSFLKGVLRPDDGSPNNPGLGPLNKPSGSTP